jgi:hypothetical protein
MKSPELTKLKILIDVLKDKHNDYYEKYSGHDFLAHADEDDNSDTISYLMEHVRKLKVTDKKYPAYLQYCYAIFKELQASVRSDLEIAKLTYSDLIYQSLTDNSSDRLFLVESSIHQPEKLDELYSVIKNDTNEKLSDVVLGVIDNYKIFEEDRKRRLSNINSYFNYFSKCFDDLKK